MNIIRNFVHYLARYPVILDFLRRLLEGNHVGEKQVILKELPDRLSVRTLDLGCGTGVFSPFFGPEYVGIDISNNYIASARRKYPNRNFLISDARNLDFADAFFDIIFVNGVFHHINDKIMLEILYEMKRVLKLDGLALVMENISGTKPLAKLIAKLDVGEYIRTSDSYRKLLARHFNIVNTYPVSIGICDYQVFVLARN